MKKNLGIRREDKNIWESRVTLTPAQAGELIKNQKFEFTVQPSKIRAFSDIEYKNYGAIIKDDLSSCSVILGIKEMPVEFFEKEKTYVFFSHTVKGQSHNMPMLKRIMDLGCQLIDYEKIMAPSGKRLLFFGNFAGLAGMIDTLWAFGKRLEVEGLKNPFSSLKQCYQYGDLQTAKKALEEVRCEIEKAGLPDALCPLVCGFAGYGNVSKGAQEIFDILPFIKVRPEELPLLFKSETSRFHIYKVVFKVKHMAAPIDRNMIFKLWHYYKNPEFYKPIFEDNIPYLSILMNCIYWDSKYLRLVTKGYMKNLYSKNSLPPLRVIGDISCDINGAIEFTAKATSPDNPVFVYDPLDDKITDGYAGRGVVVMAIDNLPCELPKESSAYFGKSLMEFIPQIVNADYSVEFEKCNLSLPVKNAVIVYQGKLTPNYKYLEKYF